MIHISDEITLLIHLWEQTGKFRAGKRDPSWPLSSQSEQGRIRFIFAACGMIFCSVFDTLSNDSDQKQFYCLSSLHAQFYCISLLINVAYDNPIHMSTVVRAKQLSMATIPLCFEFFWCRVNVLHYFHYFHGVVRSALQYSAYRI